jgi:hypothetical protein
MSAIIIAVGILTMAFFLLCGMVIWTYARRSLDQIRSQRHEFIKERLAACQELRDAQFSHWVSVKRTVEDEFWRYTGEIGKAHKRMVGSKRYVIWNFFRNAPGVFVVSGVDKNGNRCRASAATLNEAVERLLNS